MLWADRAASWRHDMAHVSLMHGWVPTVVQVVTAVVLVLALRPQGIMGGILGGTSGRRA